MNNKKLQYFSVKCKKTSTKFVWPVSSKSTSNNMVLLRVIKYRLHVHAT